MSYQYEIYAQKHFIGLARSLVAVKSVQARLHKRLRRVETALQSVIAVAKLALSVARANGASLRGVRARI